MDFLDLIKILKVRDLGVDVARKFREDIFRRELMMQNADGRLMLGKYPQVPAGVTGGPGGAAEVA